MTAFDSRRPRAMTSLACSILILGACASAAAPDRVSFASWRPGSWDIYRITGPGAPPQRLTTHPDLDYDAIVSPDGRWLVFTSERRGTPDLYVQDLQAAEAPRLLIDNDAMEDQAAFSPDGRSLAFVSTIADNAEIYLLPFQPDRTASMEEARNLTQHSSGDFRPAFSPDGRRLAFSSDRDLPISALGAFGAINRFRDGDLYVLDLETGDLSRLTDEPGWDGSPAWSADGATIAFYHAEPLTVTAPPRSQIRLIGVDGVDPRVLTPEDAVGFSPRFTTDGRIVYTRRNTNGRWQIVSVDADGMDERVESAASATVDYWNPVAVVSPDVAIIAHGTGPNDSGAPEASWAPLADGPFLAMGAPFARALPDRAIELYPIREFVPVLHPTQDLVAVVQPPSTSPGGVFLARTDGTDRRPLALCEGMLSRLSGLRWSKDGEWLVTACAGAPGPDSQSRIVRARRDGNERQDVTPTLPGYHIYPDVSADGRLIVFSSSERASPLSHAQTNGAFDLYVMTVDGGDVRRLTRDAGAHLFPVFSPTARQIAFVSNRHDPASNVYDVYLLDLQDDGAVGEIRRVTENAVQEGHVAFSHDGRWLIYTSEQGGLNDEQPLFPSSPQSYGEIYAYRIADGVTVRLTHNKWEDGMPSWQAPRAR